MTAPYMNHGTPLDPLRQARSVIENDINLSPTEAFLLCECLVMRQQDRNFRAEMKERAEATRQQAREVEQNFIDYCNKSWKPNALWFRFVSGDMFATSRDIQARARYDNYINNAAQLRAKDIRAHNEAVETEELRMRGELAGSSAHAKRAFNTIAISGGTLQHFPDSEIRSVAHLPNPLAAALP